MKPVYTALSLVCFFLVAGCIRPPSQQQLMDANYGAPPPKDYKEIIKAAFYPTFFDSVHTVYQFDSPRKGYAARSRVINTKEMYGWIVCGTINSKHKLAGYASHTGPRPFFALFKNEKLVQKVVGQAVESKYALNRFNAAIKQVCTQAPIPEESSKK